MASLLAGAAAGVALYDWLGSKGQQLTITNDVTTNMSVSATTNSVTDCFEAASGSQVIDITQTDTDNYEANLPTACGKCLEKIQSIIDARTKLEQDANLANSAYQPQTANPSLVTQMTTGSAPPGQPQNGQPSVSDLNALGPCTAVCFGIVATGVSQTETFFATQNCSVQNVDTTDISQNIQGQISSYLKNQQDIIGQLESAFTSNQESIGTDLSSTLSQNVTNHFTQDLYQTMSASQTTKISGNSLLISNVNQGFTGRMVGNLEVNNTVTDQLRQSAQYSIAQSLLNKNDTIGDLSKDFLQVIQTMSTLLEELTSQILILIGAVLAGVMLVVGALYVFDKDFHGWANNTLESVSHAQVTHYNRMQTDPKYRAEYNAAKTASPAPKTQTTS